MSRGARLPVVILYGQEMFDEEYDDTCHHDTWEDEEDAERIRDAVAAAAALGLLVKVMMFDYLWLQAHPAPVCLMVRLHRSGSKVPCAAMNRWKSG